MKDNETYQMTTCTIMNVKFRNESHESFIRPEVGSFNLSALRAAEARLAAIRSLDRCSEVVEVMSKGAGIPCL